MPFDMRPAPTIPHHDVVVEAPGLVGYLVAVAAITISPGPDTLLVVNRAASYGVHVGIVTAIGSASRLLVWGAAAAAGIAAILAASATAFEILRIAGAVFLGYLGVRALWNSTRSVTLSSQSENGASASRASSSFRSSHELAPEGWSLPHRAAAAVRAGDEQRWFDSSGLRILIWTQ
jgi:hypothetical protein